MNRRSMLRTVIALGALPLMAGCEVPSVPGVGTPGPTLRGQVNGEAVTDLRVGLLGSKAAGAAKREVATAPVSASGAYTLQLPNSPPLDLMLNANDSVAFTLTAYHDLNQNGRYDATDRLSDAAAQTGTFRFFLEDGPPGSYKAGWNLYNNSTGTYTQGFETAFVLQSI